MTNIASVASPCAKIFCPLRKDIIFLPAPAVERKVFGLKPGLLTASSSPKPDNISCEHGGHKKECSILLKEQQIRHSSKRELSGQEHRNRINALLRSACDLRRLGAS